MPPFSLRAKADRGRAHDDGVASAYETRAMDLGLSGIVPSENPHPPHPSGIGKLSLRRGPVKPPAPNQDDDDEALASSGLSMAGSVAVSLRRPLRQSTGVAEPEPFSEAFVPRPPSGRKPSRTGSRPTPQAAQAMAASGTLTQQERISTRSSVDGESRPTYDSSTIARDSHRRHFQMGQPVRAGAPMQPRAPEDTVPTPAGDEDEWRISNCSLSWRSTNSRGTFSRAKSTPSRGRNQRPMLPSCGSRGSPAGVITSPSAGSKLLRGGRRPPPREAPRSEGDFPVPTTPAQERDTTGSRRTNSFTSRGTGEIDFEEGGNRPSEQNGRGSFNFGDMNGDLDDDEGMLADTIGDY